MNPPIPEDMNSDLLSEGDTDEDDKIEEQGDISQVTCPECKSHLSTILLIKQFPNRVNISLLCQSCGTCHFIEFSPKNNLISKQEGKKNITYLG